MFVCLFHLYFTELLHPFATTLRVRLFAVLQVRSNHASAPRDFRWQGIERTELSKIAPENVVECSASPQTLYRILSIREIRSKRKREENQFWVEFTGKFECRVLLKWINGCRHSNRSIYNSFIYLISFYFRSHGRTQTVTNVSRSVIVMNRHLMTTMR